MATVTHSVSLAWNTNELPPSGFAKIADLKLGDGLFSSRLSKQDFLDTAWITIEAHIGTEFEVPLSETLPRSTRNYLKTIHAYLASSAILIETNGDSEDGVSATGLWMRAEADGMLEKLVNGVTLDGLVRRIEASVVDTVTGLARNVPGISTKDAASAFDVFEQVAHGPRDAYIGSRGAHSDPYVPGAGLTRR